MTTETTPIGAGESSPAPDGSAVLDTGIFGLCACGSPLVMDGPHMICYAHKRDIIRRLKELPHATARAMTQNPGRQPPAAERPV